VEPALTTGTLLVFGYLVAKSRRHIRIDISIETEPDNRRSPQELDSTEHAGGDAS